jgi:hypothetical protein
LGLVLPAGAVSSKGAMAGSEDATATASRCVDVFDAIVVTDIT